MIKEKVKEKLDLIDTILNRYGETIYCAVSKEKVENYCKWCLENCNGLSLAEEYTDIIAEIDCFDFNGLAFYSINECSENNVYESNEIYWENENLRKYLFVGEDSISWYGIAIDSGEYYILDKPSGSVISEHFTFEELFSSALSSVL
ncbi:MAG: YrhA family protein [Erysipelotrichaceae bacterium]